MGSREPTPCGPSACVSKIAATFCTVPVTMLWTFSSCFVGPAARFRSIPTANCAASSASFDIAVPFGWLPAVPLARHAHILSFAGMSSTNVALRFRQNLSVAAAVFEMRAPCARLVTNARRVLETTVSEARSSRIHLVKAFHVSKAGRPLGPSHPRKLERANALNRLAAFIHASVRTSGCGPGYGGILPMKSGTACRAASCTWCVEANGCFCWNGKRVKAFRPAVRRPSSASPPTVSSPAPPLAVWASWFWIFSRSAGVDSYLEAHPQNSYGDIL